MSQSDDFYLADLSPKDKPWDTHRAAADRVSELYRGTSFDRYAVRMDKCSQWLKFALQLKAEGEVLLKLNKALFCRVRNCPVCQWRRTLTWKARFYEGIPRLVTDYPTARFLLLTLTVRNCPLEELRTTLAHMNKSWERLSQLKAFPAIGWVRSVEVTRSSDRSAHPHFHCLLMVPAGYFGSAGGYLSQSKWTDLWKRSLRADYTPIVDVRAIKPRGNLPKDELSSYIITAVTEVLKYSVKESDLLSDLDWLIDLTEQLHRTRAVSIGGVLKDYISDSEPEDLLITNGEDEETGEETGQVLTFGWREMVRKYVKKPH